MSNDLEKILEQCYTDTAFCGKVLFPEAFSRPFDALHDQIFDLLENSNNPRKVVVAPRGMGKTTIDNLLIPAKKMLFQEKRYIVPVGASAETAVEQSENLKTELLNNENIEALFDITPDSSTFSKTNWIVEIGDYKVNVRPKGAAQKLRGMKWVTEGGHYRPDLIICDDLEDEETVANEDRRKKLSDWFHGALMGLPDKSQDNWEIIVIGTLLHEDSLLMNLVENPNWDTVVLELCDDDLNTKAPNYMTTEKVKEMHQEYKDAGKLDVFAREYRSQPISKEDAVFQQSYFKYYNERDVSLDSNRDVENMVIVDIARTTKVHSAHSAVVGVAVDLSDETIYVRDVVHGKFHPDEIYDHAINMCQRIGAQVMGVEVTGLNEFVTYPLRNELFRRARNVELIELQARGGVTEKGKVERVRSLVPFYRRGMVYHNKAATVALEQQLISFPKSKRWDIMDALGYVPEMLEKGERYMYRREKFESPEDIEAEFRELAQDYRLPKEEDFRII